MKTGDKVAISGLGVGTIVKLNLRACHLIPGADPDLQFARLRLPSGKYVLVAQHTLREVSAPIQRQFLGAA